MLLYKYFDRIKTDSHKFFEIKITWWYDVNCPEEEGVIVKFFLFCWSFFDYKDGIFEKEGESIGTRNFD